MGYHIRRAIGRLYEEMEGMVHLDLTKERDDHVPFIKRLFSKPRKCNTKKMEPLMQTLEKIAAEHGKTIAQVSLNWLATNPEVNVFPTGNKKCKAGRKQYGNGRMESDLQGAGYDR